MGMIPIFDDPHAISLTPNPELVSEMARSGYQNTPDLYQIMTMHMHEQAPSTKGPEPHNRPLSTSAPGAPHTGWPRSLLSLRRILEHPRPEWNQAADQITLTPFRLPPPSALESGQLITKA